MARWGIRWRDARHTAEGNNSIIEIENMSGEPVRNKMDRRAYDRTRETTLTTKDARSERTLQKGQDQQERIMQSGKETKEATKGGGTLLYVCKCDWQAGETLS